MQGGFAMGIKIARFDLKKSLEENKVMLERIAMAAKWKQRHNICMAAKRQGCVLRFTEGSQEGFEEGQGA